MQTVIKIGERILLGLLIFLLFLVVFQQRLHVPAWLQVVGRMHPMFLHFPIVLLLLSYFTFWLPVNQQNKEWYNLLRLVAALSAAVTAIMGLFLLLEDDKTGTLIKWHEWGGISIALLSFLFYFFYSFFNNSKVVGRSFTLIGSLGIIATGHFGASLTHGNNYLLAPVASMEKKVVPVDQAVIFADVIKPVFEEKCLSCHGAASSKGGLILEDTAGILRGGKTGPLFIAGNPDSSLIMYRILLPGDHKRHMPPISKPALADDEIALLHQWIKSGALLNQKLTTLPVEDSFRILASRFLGPSDNNGQTAYDFPAADDKKIAALTNNYRVIEPQGMGSPALSVHFYGKGAYSKKALEELLPLKQQIIQLSLARMPVKDEEMGIIKQMVNLEQLNLNYTDVTANGITQLTGLKKLQELSLVGTAINQSALERIAGLPDLKSVYIWNTKVDSTQLASIHAKFKNISFETGFVPSDTMIALSPPMIKTVAGMFSNDTLVEIKHPFKGVAIRYTLDGTAPDSIKSLLYKAPIPVNKSVTLIARAFKEGWYGSTPAKAFYVKKGLRPDSVELVTAPDPKYSGNWKLLTDNDLGDLNYGNGQWLGYHKGDAVYHLYFNNAVTVQNVLLNLLRNGGTYIYPPPLIEVWGGTEKDNLKLLGKVKPPPPAKGEEASLLQQNIPLSPTEVKHLKIIVKHIETLPPWIKAKGEKGWLFVNEIVVN